MARAKSSPKKDEPLRKRAEKLLAKKGERIPRKLPEDVQKLIHELQVHQVELEMQNEELRRVQLEIEESRSKYAELYDFAPVGYFTFDRKGRILEVNLPGAWLLGMERSSLMNKDFSGFVMPEFHDLFHSYQHSLFEKGAKETCELKLRKKDGSSFYASLLCITAEDREGKFTQCRCAITDITEDKQMEEKVAQLASFPELNPNPVVEADFPGTVHYLNPGAKELFPDLQLLGIQHPWLENWDSVVAIFGGKRKVSYLREVRIGDSWYEQAIYYVADSRRIRIYGFDITERKKMEEALRRSRDELEIRVQERTAELAKANEELKVEIAERRRAEKALAEQSRILEGFFTSTINPLVFLDRDFNFIRVNEAYAKACQRDISEFPGHNHFEFYPSGARAIFEQVVETKQRYQAVARPFVFPDHPEWGTTYWDWTLTPLLDNKGEVEYLVFALEDMTERKQAEKALRAASLYTRNLIEASLDPLVTISAAGKIMDVNKATEIVTGISREYLIGTDFSDYFIEPGKAREGYQQVFREGLVRDYPLAMRHASGKITDVLYNAAVYRNEDGEVQGVFAAARDVTERKRAEESLQESERQLHQLSSQLIAAQESERKRIALELHDGLGQSLTAIKFRVENFLQGISKSRIKTKAKTLEAVIPMVQESVREIRRIQTDLRPSILDDLGILATISWFCREYQATYSGIRIEKQIEIHEQEIPESLKMVIYRIMQEALNNISKYSQADRVHLALRKTDGELELSIQDNGRGFDLPEVLSGESSKRGLGLSSMRERAEHSGGSLLIESEKGKGTLIRVSWPIEKI